MKVNVIGAGLAGCEAAYQLAKRNIYVDLYDIKPDSRTEAHSLDYLCELVCSNSFKGEAFSSGAGLLKKELLMLDSFVLNTAYKHRVEAGASLAVDREGFSKAITDYINDSEYINFITKEIKEIDGNPTIICTGPLTTDSLSKHLGDLLGEEYLYFYDAAAPIITKESVNFDIAYYKSRYDKGEPDFINCPFTEEQFNVWYDELIKAETSEIKDFELKLFEGCMPVEEMAKRGRQTLTFGPLKPKGLRDKDGNTPYAVLQLRQDNAIATLYNLVGFQTNLKWNEQKRLIRLIPGLENANIVRYGVMHRNTFINSVKYLNEHFQLKHKKNVFFAGQIVGLEGYNCAIMSGLVSALNLIRFNNNQEMIKFDKSTMIGGLINYMINTDANNFQPIGPNYGLLPELGFKHPKKQRKDLMAKRSLELLEGMLNNESIL